MAVFIGKLCIKSSRILRDFRASATRHYEIDNGLCNGAALKRKIEAHGLQAADIFLQIHAGFTEFAVNHPEAKCRTRAREQFLLTLDYANAAGSDHVTILPGVTFAAESRAGIADVRIEPFTQCAMHVHARGARRGRLQSSLKENTIDWPRMLAALHKHKFAHWIALGYVWIDWEHCNQVDVISETTLLRDQLAHLAERVTPNTPRSRS